MTEVMEILVLNCTGTLQWYILGGNYSSIGALSFSDTELLQCLEVSELFHFYKEI